MKRWIWNFLKWLTQSLNALFYPILNWLFDTDMFGDVDEYTSSVLGKLELQGNKKACKVCKFISWLFRDPDHCIKEIEYDEGTSVPQKPFKDI